MNHTNHKGCLIFLHRFDDKGVDHRFERAPKQKGLGACEFNLINRTSANGDVRHIGIARVKVTSERAGVETVMHGRNPVTSFTNGQPNITVGCRDGRSKA